MKTIDWSNGYEAIAAEFTKRRRKSCIGVSTVRRWAEDLPPGASILDLGCGDGVPVTQTLLEGGFRLYGVDASISMVQRYRKQFPNANVAHEPVEHSTFFHRRFDGVVALGLMFLLRPDAQTRLIQQVAGVLVPGGRLLFTSPKQPCRWDDIMTGRESTSLGLDVYRQTGEEAGLKLVDTYLDEGENHYFSFVKTSEASKRCAPTY